MPALRVLDVQLKYEPDLTFDTFTSLRNLFPHLHSLKLSGVFIPVISPMLRSLHTLELHNQYHSAGPKPSIDDLLVVLERCPSLEQLTLSSAGPVLATDTCDYPALTRRVNLPSPRWLELWNAPENVSYVLAHLLVPPTAYVRLITRINVQDQANIPTYSRLLPRDKTSLPLLSEVKRLALAFANDHGTIRFTAYTHAKIPLGNMRLSMLVYITGPRESRPFRSVISELSTFSASPLVDLTISDELAYRGERSTDDALWRDTLGCFPRLERFTSESLPDMETLIHALRGTSALNQEEPLCPHLTSLNVGDISTRKAESVAGVLDTLNFRASRGLYVKSLRIYNWDEDEHHQDDGVQDMLVTIESLVGDLFVPF